MLWTVDVMLIKRRLTLVPVSMTKDTVNCDENFIWRVDYDGLRVRAVSCNVAAVKNDPCVSLLLK